jgi:transcriptional regulator with GAF, ATPase, and Fis domain
LQDATTFSDSGAEDSEDNGAVSTESETGNEGNGAKRNLRPRPMRRDVVASSTQEPRKRKAPKTFPEPKRRKASSDVASERARLVQALEDAKLKVAACAKQLKEFDETHQ